MNGKSMSGKKTEWAGRLMALCLGVMFLVSGGAKVVDLSSFVREFSAYGIITGQPLALVSAWGLLALELALGAALVAGWRLRHSLYAAAALMLLFIVAVLWAWQAGTTEDCGCFGSLVKRSPSEGLVEDLAILAVIAISWLCVRKAPSDGSLPRFLVVVAAGLAGIFLPFAFGFSPSAVLNPPLPGAPLPAFVLSAPNSPDLHKGDYLLFVMETGCDHCRSDIPAVNEIARTPGLPQVVALCPNSPAEVVRFVSLFAPPFSLFMVSQQDFSALLGSAPTTPRYLLVRDGRILKNWDGRAPTIAELSAK